MQLLLLAPLIAFATIACAQGDRPKPGVTIDETRTVRVSQSQPSSCVSIALDGATVILDKAALELLAVSRPKSWTNEVERVALIAGQRAERLLTAASKDRDSIGCNSVTSDTEIEQLILTELEQGNLAVRDATSNRVVDVVHVRFLGDRSSQTNGRGYIMVSLPGADRPFLNLSWWVA